MAPARGCSDLFEPSRFADYGFDISADEWAKMDYEFRNRDALKAAGVDFKTYHPIVFHSGSETVADAMVRLKGESSWVRRCWTTATRRGCSSWSRSKRSTPPRSSTASARSSSTCPTTTTRSCRNVWASRRWRELLGQPAPCANSARVTINGQYYGLYVNEEHVGNAYIKRVFPEAPNGDLFEGG